MNFISALPVELLALCLTSLDIVAIGNFARTNRQFLRIGLDAFVQIALRAINAHKSCYIWKDGRLRLDLCGHVRDIEIARTGIDQLLSITAISDQRYLALLAALRDELIQGIKNKHLCDVEWELKMILTVSRLTKPPEDFFVNVLAIVRGQCIQALYDGQSSLIHHRVVDTLDTLLFVTKIPDDFFLDALRACQYSLMQDINKINNKWTFKAVKRRVGRTLNIMKWLLSNSKLPNHCFVEIISPIRRKLFQKINNENIAESRRRENLGFVIELSSRLTILDLRRLVCLSIKASGQPTSDILEARMKVSMHILSSCGFGFYCWGTVNLWSLKGDLLQVQNCQLCSHFQFLPAFEAACSEMYTAARIRSSFYFARRCLPQNPSGSASVGAYPPQQMNLEASRFNAPQRVSLVNTDRVNPQVCPPCTSIPAALRWNYAC